MAAEKRGASRNRNSAKRAGSKFEIDLADRLRTKLDNDTICRQDKNGANDLGDIANVKVRTSPLTIECKNTSAVNLTGAMREAQKEALNVDHRNGVDFGDEEGHAIPVVAHKRHGVGAIGKQWITMEVDDFCDLLNLLND